MKPLFDIQDVWFDYRPESRQRTDWLLCGLRLIIRQGEYIAVMGKNGSGKSTLGKLLQGLLMPAVGCILVEGVAIEQLSRASIVSKIGMVFQNPDNQLIATTVEDELAFGLENLAYPSVVIQRRVNQVMERLNLLDWKYRDPQTLSGGQKQKLAVASQLVMEPSCLILDEVTSMLDPRSRLEILSMIKTLHGQGITVIHITHDPDEAILADRIVVMDQGKIVMDHDRISFIQSAIALNEWDLAAPFSVELHQLLLQKGWSLQPRISSEEDLMNQLWISN